MSCSTFGLAASHISVGKFELNMFPCFRATYSGARFVSVVSLGAVLKVLQAPGARDDITLQRVQEQLLRCKAEDIAKLTEGAVAGTVGGK